LRPVSQVDVHLKLLAELRRRNVLRAAVAYVVTAWVIVESSSLLLNIFNAPEWIPQTIVIMLVAGFPVAIVFAWMFEITPDGIKHDHEVSGDARVTAASSRYLVMITIVMGMLAAGLFVVDRFLIESDTPTERRDGQPVIAVLPFETVGSAAGAALADGLHHDLLTRMSKLRAFAVISRTSMLEYRGSTKNIRDIGRELGATFILEGGVQLVGDRVRINAQLIDASVDEHLWADTYDRELSATDLFTIQSGLAIDIADQLELTLSAEDREQAVEIPTRNTEAYTAYLRGLATLDNLDLGHRRGTLAHTEIQTALSLDPAFAAAWAQLIRHSGFWTVIWDDYDSMFADMSAALETLRHIAPGSYETSLAEVYFLYFVVSDYEAVLPAIADLESRVALNADAFYMRGKALRRAGRLEDAYRAYLEAARLDPRSLSITDDLRTTATMLGDCERAELHAAASLALAPDDAAGRIAAAEYELQCTVDTERVDALVRDFIDLDDGALWAARGAAALSGDLERLLELFERGELHASWWGDPVNDQLVIVYILKALGRDAEAERALDAIGSTLDGNEPDTSEMQQIGYAVFRARYHGFRGDEDEMRKWLVEIDHFYRKAQSWDPISRAGFYQVLVFTYSELGLHNEAFEVLERLLSGPSFMTFHFVDAHFLFDDLKQHPGYAELSRRYGAAEPD
jgi:TolB-like protein